jgi:hypothetical protein
MTVHRHKVDGTAIVHDGNQQCEVPDGWIIAVGDEDDIRVCGAHPWQVEWLLFENGFPYGTAACDDYRYKGV